MSGIAGILTTKEFENNEKKHLENMLGKLKHRGPDGTYAHLDRLNGFATGQTYLDINGLPPHTSPILVQTTPESKKLLASANARFYDFKKTRTALELDGFQFQSKNDHEIILPLYRKYGADFVHHLRGEFAITLFDAEKKKLFLIRDRFGVKPLFYHVADRTIYWASEIKGLFAHPKIARSFSTEGLIHQLMQTMVPGTTAFEGILAVKPGHMLIVDFSGDRLLVKSEEYWDMDFPEKDQRDSAITSEYYIEQLRKELLEAVEVRLPAAYPVSSYLSGGIDSCAILGLASSLTQKPVKAYTISFDNTDYDESPIAKEMAQRVNADHEQIVLTADELYGKNYVNTLYHAERTFYNTLGVAKNLMSKKVRDTGYRIALTGEGSDELFGGYPSFKRDMFRYGMSDDASPEELESYRKLMDETNKLFTGAILSKDVISHPAMEEVCGFTPSWIQPWMQTLELARPLLHDDVLEAIKDYDPIAAIAGSFNKERLRNRHVLDKAQYTWSKTMVECQILNWGGDRVDMANAMESRPPFLDHKVVDLALQIPPHLRIKGNTEKWILRESMKHILPETLYKREKFAFMAPPSHTDPEKRKQLKSLIRLYISKEAVQNAKIFDPKRLENFLQEYWADEDPVSLTRKDALVNHILGLQILWHLFIKD